MAFIQQCVFSWSLFVRPIPSRNGAVDRHALKNFRARGELSNVEMLFVSASCKSIRNCKHVPVIYKYNFAGRASDLAPPRKGVSARIIDSILKWGVVETLPNNLLQVLANPDREGEYKLLLPSFSRRPLMRGWCHHDYRHQPLCCYLENVTKILGKCPQ